MLKFVSTNAFRELATFREALMRGQAPDKGLYVPTDLPRFSGKELDSFRGMEYWEIASVIIGKFLEGEVPREKIRELAKDAYNFEIPLEEVYGRRYVMRLDRGPTASFKDFAARMMARLMQYFLEAENRKLTILTATSGDTGSAVARAFYGMDNINIVVLFPLKEVTERQRRQMTTLGKNITAIATDGKFDDCQEFVKRAFSDKDLEYLSLSSANSINVGRLIPQTGYYFYAYSKLAKKGEKATFSIPSGNFGNLMAGLMSKKMGLPVERFIAATNENDEFPKFLETDSYERISPSRNCISNAMNVGHPSNLARIVWYYSGQMDETGRVNTMPDMARLKEDVYSVRVTDGETRQAIKEAYEKHKLLLEPHGAVAWAGLQRYLKENRDAGLCISLETAHPAKFPDELQRIGANPELPESMEGLDRMEEHYESIKSDYNAFKEFLLARFK